MKKIYLLLSAIVLTGGITAQTLTKALNEPVSGDMRIKRQFDSVGTVPKNTGANQTWSFLAFAMNSNTASSTFTTASSAAGSASFAAATVAEMTSSGDINFWKSASTPTTQFEMHGIYNPLGIEFNFSSNPAIFMVWPVAFGDNMTDVASGTVSAFSQTGTVNSTVTTNASGTGTVIIPGNVMYNNVLQVKTTQTLTALVGSGFSTVSINVVSTNYAYYNSTQKFPLVEVLYEKQTQTSAAGPTVNTTGKTYIHSALVTGINEANFDAVFDMFPNPAKEFFTVNLTNTNNAKGSIEIYNELGQLSKRVDLGNESTIETKVSVSDLKPGVYFVKTTIGSRSSSRKLIIQ
jgi:hypothetical protein